jgi:thiol-disulfide isomerase/thioredoxin
MRPLVKKASKGIKNMMNNRYAILILLLIVVGGYFLFKWCQNKKSPFEMFSGGAKLYFFYADWCGYCKKFKPEWKKLKAEPNLGVQLEEVDCSNEAPALAKEYNVGGFPTLILVHSSNKVTYEGERSADAIISFIKDNQ